MPSERSAHRGHVAVHRAAAAAPHWGPNLESAGIGWSPRMAGSRCSPRPAAVLLHRRAVAAALRDACDSSSSSPADDHDQRIRRRRTHQNALSMKASSSCICRSSSKAPPLLYCALAQLAPCGPEFTARHRASSPSRGGDLQSRRPGSTPVDVIQVIRCVLCKIAAAARMPLLTAGPMPSAMSRVASPAASPVRNASSTRATSTRPRR